MKNIFQQANEKLQAAADKAPVPVRILTWSLPAVSTCPGAFTCKLPGACFGCNGRYVMPNVKEALRRNRETCGDLIGFYGTARAELTRAVKNAAKAGRKLFVRVHAVGDFYSPLYLATWLQLAKLFPSITFYAYSKSLPWIRAEKAAGNVPSNFVFTFSQGGRFDATIDRETEKHTRMFATLAELKAAGYQNTTGNDLLAADAGIIKVGLVYHGSRAGAASWGLTWAGNKASKEAKS
jgi:hypothetical protein